MVNLSDPSKVSHTRLSESQKVYPRHDGFDNINSYRIDILVSLVLRSCLNICEHVEEDGVVYSLPLDLNSVEEKLSLNQVIADIILYQLLTGDTDRDLCLQNDYRSQTGESLSLHNCRIGPNGSYSIFDLEGDFERVAKSDIEFLIIQQIKDLVSIDKYTSPATYQGIGPDLGFLDDEILIDRILKNTKILLEIYDSDDGRSFFLKQCSKAYCGGVAGNDIKDKENVWYDYDSNQYENFIYSLRNIYSHLSENYEELFCSGLFIRRTLRNEISFSFQLLVKGVKSYITSLIR